MFFLHIAKCFSCGRIKSVFILTKNCRNKYLFPEISNRNHRCRLMDQNMKMSHTPIKKIALPQDSIFRDKVIFFLGFILLNIPHQYSSNDLDSSAFINSMFSCSTNDVFTSLLFDTGVYQGSLAKYSCRSADWNL